MMDENVFENLNDKQKEAVLATEGYVRVIAGAGSGKTKLLVSRYAYLVQDYCIDSANILCVTFTNKAAAEMKKRIKRLIGEEYDTTLICTYHGFCNRLLRENPEKLFLNKQFQIIDSYQQKAILSEIYQKFELKLDYASFEATLHKLGMFKSNPDYVARICNPKPCRIMDKIESQDDEILEEFMQRQKATYSLDFHDLIAFAIYVLRNNDDVRSKWQERLNYIMVDEFQDSSSTEMQLIEILSEKYKNVLIVGDPDQNIYEWRGSDVKLLVDFDKEHIPTQTIILNQNYRSTPEILKCANTLIERNTLRLKKELFTHNPKGAEVIHYHSKNDFEEMDQVINNIKSLSRIEGYEYSDFAILYRSGFLSRIAEKKLVERNIPYEIFGGVRFYQRMEILDILAYLKLIAFDDDTSFKRIVNTPRRRFGRTKLSVLEEMRDGSSDENQLTMESVQGGLPVGSLFSTLKVNVGRKEFANSDASGFVALIENMRDRIKELRISEIVNEITSLSGYEKYIRELGDEERLDNLAEFKRISNEFEREFWEELTLEEFLQQISLQSGEGTDSSQDTVKLMTIHAAKGLEFPVVFILGFTEGVFPSSKTIEERKLLGLEEERRLCYVAITRAEKRLFLMDSEGLSPKGIKKLCSRFLEEIGTENYKRIGLVSDELAQESREYAIRLNREIEAELRSPLDMRIGDLVEHHAFGSGVVQGIDIKRGCYIVKFDNLAQPRNITKSYFGEYHKAVNAGNEIVIDNPDPLKEDEEEENYYNLEETEFEDIDEAETFLDDPDEDLCLMNLYRREIGQSVNEKEENIQEAAGIPQESYNSDYDDRTREAIIAAREKAKNSPNLWKRNDVPHDGWSCVGVEDLGAPVGICEMCGYQIIRYAHHMEHPRYRSLICGCVCAGKMEGNIEEAKRREAEFKNMQARRINFFKRKWRRSKKGNDYLKIDDHVVVIYNIKTGNQWKYSIDNEFSKAAYNSRERAMSDAFEKLELIRNSRR